MEAGDSPVVMEGSQAAGPGMKGDEGAPATGADTAAVAAEVEVDTATVYTHPIPAQPRATTSLMADSTGTGDTAGSLWDMTAKLGKMGSWGM